MVKRRMAPLSKLTTEIILPLETLGSYLDSNKKTVDEELENKNLQEAGKTLSEVWKNVIIDGYPLIANYVPLPEQKRKAMEIEKSAKLIAQHLRQSQYTMQIVKCDLARRSCCLLFRSNYKEFFPYKELLPCVHITTYELNLETYLLRLILSFGTN